MPADEGGNGLRVVVVGCGAHARNTVYPSLVSAGFQLVACAAAHQESADATARRFGVGSAYACVTRMLERHRDEADAAVLVLPPDGYQDTFLSCLQAGLPIYAEKPLAMSQAALRDLESYAAAGASRVMVGYMKRFAPAYARARDLTRAPGFGVLSGWQSRWAMGPGHPTVQDLLRENATHHLDLARFLMGEVEEVQAQSARVGEGRFTIGVLLRFASGAVGTLEIGNTSSWDHVNEWVTVTGDGAVVHVDNVDTCILRRVGEAEQHWRPNMTVPLLRTSSLWITGFVPAFQHFAAVVKGEETCRSDLSSGRKTMQLAERVQAAVEAHW